MLVVDDAVAAGRELALGHGRHSGSICRRDEALGGDLCVRQRLLSRGSLTLQLSAMSVQPNDFWPTTVSFTQLLEPAPGVQKSK